jgi:transcriptional regulator with XRE-family HTH domain
MGCGLAPSQTGHADAFSTCGMNLRTVSIPGFSEAPSRMRHRVENPTPAATAALCNSEWVNFFNLARTEAAEGMEEFMSRMLSDTEQQPQASLQSDGERDDAYRSDMPPAIRAVIWKNLEDLMTAAWGRTNLRRLARESGIGVATIARIKNSEQNLGVEMVVALARPFRRRPWELLSPNLSGYSAEASEIAAAFDELADEPQRRRAYALIVQILEFGNTGGSPPSQPPTTGPAPSPETPRTEAPSLRPPRRSRGKARQS